MARQSTGIAALMVLVIAVASSVGFILGATHDEAMASPNKEQVKQVKSSQLPAAAVGPAVGAGHTVYMSRDGIEKGKSAVHMTQLHQAMAAKGYFFASLVMHEENNDLKGWWVTYLPAS